MRKCYRRNQLIAMILFCVSCLVPTLKLVINGKFVDQYTFLDEEYYSIPSKKQKEKKQDYIYRIVNEPWRLWSGHTTTLVLLV